MKTKNRMKHQSQTSTKTERLGKHRCQGTWYRRSLVHIRTVPTTTDELKQNNLLNRVQDKTRSTLMKKKKNFLIKKKQIFLKMTHTHVTRMLKSTTATSPTSVESRSEKHPPKWGVGTVKATTGRKATRLAFVTGHWQRVPEALEVAPPGRRWRRLKMRLQCDT